MPWKMKTRTPILPARVARRARRPGLPGLGQIRNPLIRSSTRRPEEEAARRRLRAVSCAAPFFLRAGNAAHGGAASSVVAESAIRQSGSSGVRPWRHRADKASPSPRTPEKRAAVLPSGPAETGTPENVRYARTSHGGAASSVPFRVFSRETASSLPKR
jgi:hypothetical protein